MILPISYGYIKLLGGEGLTQATRMAIHNANYLKAKLKSIMTSCIPVPTEGGHEMILDCNIFHRTAVWR
jgi:glycine dehydrogenase